MRFVAALATLAISLCLSGHCSAKDVVARFDIPSGDLIGALERIANQSKVEFIYSAQDLLGLLTAGLHGQFTVEQAIRELLQNTQLVVSVHPSGAFLVARRQQASRQLDEARPNREDGKSARDTGGSSNRAKYDLTEILVTASKRLESIERIAGGISVISSEQLADRGANELEDYLGVVPGAAMQSYGHTGFDTVFIRGIAPQGLGPTVATYVDEIPVGPAGALTRGAYFTVDLDPTDLERVEVLKGPQGTLYGASSLGGVVKYVTRAPDLAKANLRISEEFSSTEHGASGMTVRISGSLPLVDQQLAIGVSAFYRHAGGFIDDRGVGGPDTNRANDRGFRAVVLYEPVINLSVRITALEQTDTSHGNDVVDYNLSTGRPVGPSLSQLRYVDEPSFTRLQLFSAQLQYHLPSFDLISASGYSSLQPDNVLDETAALGQLGFSWVTPQNPVGYHTDEPAHNLSQELRLESHRLGIMEWMLGGFFQHESLQSAFFNTAYESPTSEPPLGQSFREGTLTEHAAFADATAYLRPDFDVTVGFRHSSLAQTRSQHVNGLLYNPGNPYGYDNSDQEFRESADTYLVALRWQTTENLMLYGRAASAYRPGGGRDLPPGAPPNLTDYYTSDSLWSYETGIKGHTPGRRAKFDFDVFWIRWTNIQTLQPLANGQDVDGNAGTAHSRGMEFQTVLGPFAGLTLDANAALTDARFTESLPQTGVFDGERLFYVPKWTAALSAKYQRALGNGWELAASAEGTYQSLRLDQYRTPLPAYSIWNARVEFAREHYRIAMYCDNATDKLALLGYDASGATSPYGFAVNRPRTVGIEFAQELY